jgi:hypothetical protein
MTITTEHSLIVIIVLHHLSTLLINILLIFPDPLSDTSIPILKTLLQLVDQEFLARPDAQMGV